MLEVINFKGGLSRNHMPRCLFGKFFGAFQSKCFNRFSLGEITNLEYTCYPMEIFVYFGDQSFVYNTST